MIDKIQKIREIIDNMQNLTMDKNGNFTSDYNQGKYDALCEVDTLLQELLVDSLQEEPVSIWHDASKETPIQGSNILMIRKEEGSDFPPIAGCFHGINSRLDGRNWGYYNGFCYNEIEPPLKWAYVDDILNLSNVQRTVKDWKEEPVSEDLEEFALQYAGHHAPYDSCMQEVEDAVKAGAEWGKNQAMAEIQAQSMALAHGCPEENTSEDLKEAADNALESISDQYDIISVGSCLEMFRLGAEWQKAQEYTCYEEAFEDGAKWKKQKIVDKACKWIDENAAKYLVDRFVGSTRVVGIDTSITDDFRKDMED